MANRKIASWPNKQILNWKIAQGEWTASVFQAWQTQTEKPSEGLEINQANCSQIGAVIVFHEPIQAYLVLLYITLSLFADNSFLFLFLLQTESLWKPCFKQVYQHHFSDNICLLCVFVSHFGNSHNISNPSPSKRFWFTEGSDDC